jgi:hypothetical protein
MATNKILYLIVGLVMGIIVVLLLERNSSFDVFAAPPRQSETVSNQDFIAIGSLTKTDNNILWLIDTKNRKLFIYEYYQEIGIKLRAARDIQYDVNTTDGYTMPFGSKQLDPQPSDMRKIFEDIRKTQKKEEKESPPK